MYLLKDDVTSVRIKPHPAVQGVYYVTVDFNVTDFTKLDNSPALPGERIRFKTPESLDHTAVICDGLSWLFRLAEAEALVRSKFPDFIVAGEFYYRPDQYRVRELPATAFA